MPFGLDVQCAECATVRYIWLHNSQAEPDPDDKKCPRCGSVKFIRCVGGNYVTSNDPTKRSEMLKQRSFEHSQRTAKDNVERIVEKSRKKNRSII